jgi:thiosulfate/3-mercaptopyruvate sulfurtransferase
MYTRLINPHQLQTLRQDGQALLVFDCSGDLMQPHLGRIAYQEQHIPGAYYADLNKDLSSHAPERRASGGRHPLPTREDFALWLAQKGLNADTQVVVYDRNGMNYCGRLWWMIKWCGHLAVAVLDGGLQAWKADGYPLEQGPEPQATPGQFRLAPPRAPLVTTAQILQHLENPQQTLIDARAAARYRGETEPIDPIAGHIPGALNRPFGQNLGPDGKFKAADQLRAEFLELLGTRAPQSVVHHCGSGVSAIPNVLAMDIAGFSMTTLYAGSWSEWCTTPDTPRSTLSP